MQSQGDSNSVLTGSYIVLACLNGYTNTGGSLNVTCFTNGSWSPFPNCALNGPTGSAMTTTTMATNNGVACVVDSTTLVLNNGYYTNVSLSYASSSTATGKYRELCKLYNVI